jgi:hypothetical protein
MAPVTIMMMSAMMAMAISPAGRPATSVRSRSSSGVVKAQSM